MANDQHFGNPEYTRAYMEDTAHEIANRVLTTPLDNLEILWVLARATQIVMEHPTVRVTPSHE